MTQISKEEEKLPRRLYYLFRSLLGGVGAGGLKSLPPSPAPYFASCAGILEQSMGARNRVGIGLLYWPARLHSVGWGNRFLRIDPWAH
jgi:hypothetical protein